MRDVEPSQNGQSKNGNKQHVNKTKENPKTKPLKLDLRVLYKSVTSFRLELKNSFNAVEGEEITVEKMKHKSPQT